MLLPQETALDVAITAAMNLGKRLENSNQVCGVRLYTSPEGDGVVWIANFQPAANKDGTYPAASTLQGKGPSPTAAYLDLIKKMQDKIKARHEEDKKALMDALQAQVVAGYTHVRRDEVTTVTQQQNGQQPNLGNYAGACR